MDCIAYDKDRRASAVIGSVGGVLARAPSELGPLEDYDLVGKLVRDQVLMKRVDRVRKVLQQTGMLAGGFAATRNLIRVSVISAHLQIQKTHLGNCRDDLSEHLQAIGESVIVGILDI